MGLQDGGVMMPELPDWLRGIVLIGYDGAEYRVVSTDDDGNIIAVMKGADGDTLRTLSVNPQGLLEAVLYGTFGSFLRAVAVDTNGQIITILKGASGNNVDVDTNGYLTAVLMGSYEGALRTVALDDDGRLSAFVIDSLDAWGQLVAVGNAELAARLGALQALDRRGQIFLYETFKHGMQGWDTDEQGTGADVSLDPTSCLRGGYSVRLTAGSDGQALASITKAHHALVSSRIGLEVSFSMGVQTDDFDVRLEVDDGTTAYTGVVRYSYTDGKLYVIDDELDEQEVCAVSLGFKDAAHYFNLKLVINIDTGKYARVLWGGTEYDVSAHALASSASAVVPYVTVEITNNGNAASNDVINVDAVIVTMQEPDNS